MRAVNAHHDNSEKGIFSIVEEDSRPAYLATLNSFVVFLSRLPAPPPLPGNGDNQPEASDDDEDEPTAPAASAAHLPENLALLMTRFKTEKSTKSLHRLLRQLFQPREYGSARLSHPTGLFFQLNAVQPDGSLANLTNLNHLLVHLIYSARLLTLWEIALHKPKTQGDREKILHMIRIE